MHPPADLSSEEEPAGRKEQTPDLLGQGRAGAVIPELGKVLMSPRPGGPVPLQCHPTRELVIHAAGLFGDLQSFMRQELDQAMATQALWPTLSSRLRVSSTPEGRSEKTPPIQRGPPGWLELPVAFSMLHFPHPNGAVAKASVCDVSLSGHLHAFVEHLLGWDVSCWLWKSSHRTNPLFWDVTE